MLLPLLLTTGVAAQVDGSPPGGAASTPAAVALEVPYLPQSEALCGGAAVAMVMRYWGARGIAPEDFATLLGPAGDGIATGALVSAVSGRGWRAFAFSGSPSMVRHHLARGRPLVTLIQVAPGRFHYVVVTGWTAEDLTLHDPASLPDQRMPSSAFEDAWSSSSRWTLLILPPEGADSSVPATVRRPAAATTAPAECADPLRLAAARADAGGLNEAESWLMAARAACPGASAPYRELAGLRLLQREYGEAVRLARSAVERDGADAHAWRTLGTAHYLRRNAGAALDAWNRIDEPIIDLVQITGLRRTRYAAAAESTGLRAGALLRADDLERAERRLGGMPAVEAARLAYSPIGGGLIRVDAAVAERPLLPVSRQELAAAGIRAVTDRRVDWFLSSPSGSGELLTASWRWWENRPSVTLGMSIPAGATLPGVLEVRGRWEEQAYRPGPPDANSDEPLRPVRERRRTLQMLLSGWRSADLRWELGAGLERWDRHGLHGRIDAGMGLRLGERAAVRADTTFWPGVGSFARLRTGAAWRSAPAGATRLVTLSAGIALASFAAPLDVWPGAGTGHARAPLLRAHPLLAEDGVIAGKAFGRRLTHGTAEYRHRVKRIGPLEVSVAGFADLARAWEGLARTRTQLDVGAGLRIGLPERGLRLDVARGLVDGEMAVSARWMQAWPAFR